MFVLTSQNSITEKTKIHISEELYNLWRTSRQLNNSANEAFGVLIGSQVTVADEFWLEAGTQPQRSDLATRTSFSLRSPHHQTMVDSFYNSSNGTLGYVGTWHTHPEPTPVPSSVDITDWHECTKRNPDRGLVFVIVGQLHICIFRGHQGSFKCVYKEKINE
jgi:integrative and conjugative element protein (TIGR02256 family)